LFRPEVVLFRARLDPDQGFATVETNDEAAPRYAFLGVRSCEITAIDIQDRHFLRVGAYASLFVRDLNVFGALLRGTDDLQLLAQDGSGQIGQAKPDYRAWFLQADYVIFPWLQATGRYETVRPGDPSVPSLRLGTANVSALIRANVKAMLEYQRDLREGLNHSLNGLVRFAF
jgi:hypothetical protein